MCCTAQKKAAKRGYFAKQYCAAIASMYLKNLLKTQLP